MKTRNLIYEKKFRAYLFSFDFETHKEICKNINVIPSTGGKQGGIRAHLRSWINDVLGVGR